MTRRFCHICGKVTEELIEGKCRDCFLKEKKVLTLPERVEAKICKNCLSHFKKGNWVYVGEDLEKVLEEVSVDSVRNSLILEGLEEAEVGIGVEGIKQVSKAVYEISCSVEVKGKLSGIPYETKENVTVKARFETCNNCSRRSGRYYVAILQVRGEVPEGIQKDVEEIIAPIEKKDGRAFITEVKVLKGGIDFYVGSASAARKIANGLREKFGGEIRESPKLVGVDAHGKELYRVSISLRISLFKKGDIVEINGNEYEVSNFVKGKVILFGVGDRKRVSFPAEVLKRATKVSDYR